MKKTTSGFTVVELIVVVAAIAVLASIVIINYMGVTKQSYLTGAKADVDSARKQIDLYKADTRSYPASITTCPATTGNICVKSDQNTLLYVVSDPTGDNTYAVGSIRGTQGYFESLGERSGVGGTQYADIVSLINQLGLKTYRLTFDIKTSSAAVGNTATVRFVTAPGSKYGGLNQSVAVSNTYATRTITFTATNQSALTTAMVEFVASTGGETLYIDNFSLQLN